MSHLIETIIDEEMEVSYTFSATFEFLRRLNAKGKNCALVFHEMANGSLDPEYILNVLVSSITEIDGEVINEAKREKTCINLIERFGLQECSLLAREMLSRAMIGEIKSKKLEAANRIKTIMDHLFPILTRKSFLLRGLPWAAASMISGVVASLTLWLFVMPT